MWCGFGVCLCGHFSRVTLCGTVPGFLIGSSIFLLSGKSLSITSIFTFDWVFSFAGLSLLTWLLGQSIGDVFWYGHNPIFPGA